MKAVVLGATGYTGQVLLRLLAEHAHVERIVAVSSSQAGKAVREIDPGLPPSLDAKIDGGKLVGVDAAAKAAPDVVFSALPHLASAQACAPFFGTSVVIDLSADFRIRDAAVFAAAYGEAPPRPDLLPGAAFGLTEWYTEKLKTADVIANPGCYPTCTLLPLLPLARAGLLKGTVIVNAISGISGAGRKEKAEYLYVERSENANAYNPGTSHRHAPEILQELRAADAGLSLLFTPHLAPLRRGMEATTVVELAGSAAGVEPALKAAYDGRPFVKLNGSRLPQTRDVWGSNRCDIAWKVEGKHLMLFSVIDNLVKGASGQAVQNMNVRFGLPETAGLRTGGEF